MGYNTANINMKRVLFMVITYATILVCFSSCQKENDNSFEGVEIRMRNSDNGGDKVNLLLVDSTYADNYQSGHYWYTRWYDSYINLEINRSNNFYMDSHYANGEIVCVGSVKKLGQIKNIPSSGWTNSSISVKPGCGYIIRSKNDDPRSYKHYCHYARIYVVSWIEGTSGGILGATIRYQDDWKCEDYDW